MKKLITVFVLLLCYCVPVFASEQEAINSFTAVVNQIEREIKQTYTDEYAKVYFSEKSKYNKKAYWYKSRFGNLNLSYDIKKTDSLISPYNGIINISFDTLRYYDWNNSKGEFKTKLEAVNAKLTKATLYGGHKWKFLYAYQDNKWVLKKYNHNFAGSSSWQDVTTDDSIGHTVMWCKN